MRACAGALAWGTFSVAAAGEASNASDDERFAARLAERVNQYRDRKGAAALSSDASLASIAHEHSAAMAAAKRLSHDGFESRIRRSRRSLCVENVGWNYRTPDDQLDGWQRSPEHDRNLLDARVKQMGIGVASGYVTFIACQ